MSPIEALESESLKEAYRGTKAQMMPTHTTYAKRKPNKLASAGSRSNWCHAPGCLDSPRRTRSLAAGGRNHAHATNPKRASPPMIQNVASKPQ